MYRIVLEWLMAFLAAGAWKFTPGAAGVTMLAAFVICLAAYVYLLKYGMRPSRWDAILAPLADEPRLYRTFKRAARWKRRVSDRQAVAAAVPRCGACLELADEALQDDKALVLAAIAHTPYAFRFASERLRNDRQVVLEAVKRAGALVQDLAEQLKDDDEIATAALRDDPQNLRFLSDRLRSDKDFVVNGVGIVYPRLKQLAALPLPDAAFFLAFYTDRVPHKLALRQFFPALDPAAIDNAESQASAFMRAVPRIASDYVDKRSASTHQGTMTALKTQFPGFGDEVYQQAISAQVAANR
jgi:hypothetical protein